MKTLLVFSIFLIFSICPSLHSDNLSESRVAYSGTADSSQTQVQQSVPGNSNLSSLSAGIRNYADHPVLQGERATDAGSSAVEHLAPLIFMVIAFVLAVVAGCLSLYWRWYQPEEENLRGLTRNLVGLLVVSCAFTLITAMLLINIFSWSDDNHSEGTRSHLLELILSVGAFICISTWIASKQRRGLIYLAAFFQLFVIIILLVPRNIYKICNDGCVMHGSQAGVIFDQPCADNIAFMTLHHTNDISVEDFNSYYDASSFPLFYEYSSPIAMHDPIFPAVKNNKSDPITFTLKDEKKLIDTCTLFVRQTHYTMAGLSHNLQLDSITASADNWAVGWKFDGNNRYKRTLKGGAPDGVDSLYHSQQFNVTTGGVTYITYKFVVQYLAYENESGVSVQTPPERIDIHFVLQDYLSSFPMHPVPVYIQGHPKDLLDVLFIPSIAEQSDAMIDQAFQDDFRKKCRSIIQEAIFTEPSLKFWRRQFNFWINNQAGVAKDASCGDCCHDPPENFTSIPRYISGDIEFKALLHKGTQWDFTDHCNTFFSAEMDLVDNLGERSSFLHELGHAAYGLSDEYYGGYNEEAEDHLPNNWLKKARARDSAPLRHKTEDDVRVIF